MIGLGVFLAICEPGRALEMRTDGLIVDVREEALQAEYFYRFDFVVENTTPQDKSLSGFLILGDRDQASTGVPAESSAKHYCPVYLEIPANRVTRISIVCEGIIDSYRFAPRTVYPFILTPALGQEHQPRSTPTDARPGSQNEESGEITETGNNPGEAGSDGDEADSSAEAGANQVVEP